MDRRTKLRMAVQERRGMLLPGAANGLTARVIEDLGYEAVYLTGAGLANTSFGMPDLGMVTMTEVVEMTAAISDCCALPLVVDADTGFGNPLNVVRTVRSLERAGACALQIEDQVFPKRCGHFSGKEVIPTEEMVTKIKAAVDTRHSEDLLIIARTDVLALEGLSSALDRASVFIEAGADMTFIEAPSTVEEMSRIPSALPVPQVVNLVVGGRTPLCPRAELQDMGFSLVLYANAALQASLLAMTEVLGSLRQNGSLDAVHDRLADFTTRQSAVRIEDWQILETTYRR